jgi:hypothetical protein
VTVSWAIALRLCSKVLGAGLKALKFQGNFSFLGWHESWIEEFVLCPVDTGSATGLRPAPGMQQSR